MRMASVGLLAWGSLMAGACFVRGQETSVRAQETETDLIDKFETHQSPAAKPARVAKPAQTAKPEFLPRPSKSEQNIIDALDKTTEVAFRDNDLMEAVNYLMEIHSIEIWVDTVRVNPDDVKVTLEASKVSLRSCLNLLLEPHGLRFLIEDDVLKVTSSEFAESKLITRTYPVGDLFESVEEAKELRDLLECGLGLNHDGDAARTLVISTTARVVVMRQSHQVHDQLLQILRDLRDDRAENSSHELVLNVGFERDTSGKKKSEIPFVFHNERYVEIPAIGDDLKDKKRALTTKYGQDAVRNTIVLIRADSAVPTVQIQQLIKKCQDAGFTRFSLRAVQEEE
jgi:biopolymer transport protein ExbD